jgi:serine/threonine-protein kinase
VFSLGVVIYELACGVRPFKGDSATSVLASIVKDTPVPLVNLRPDLPPALNRIVNRCLAKEAGRRYQSVLDLRNDLEEIQEGLGVGTATAPTAAGRPLRRRRTLVIALAAAVIVMLAAGVGYLFWRMQSAETMAVEFQRSTIAPPSGVQVQQQEGSGSPLLAISPDGRWIAFHGSSSDPDRRGLYLRSTSEIEPRRIRDEKLGSPFFSPDSKWLGFWSNDVLWKVPVAGGAADRICEVKGGLRGASWGDNNQIVFSVAEGVFRVSGDGGSPAPLVVADGKAVQFYFPHVLRAASRSW